jgi:hypothetical protein|mmetsp:Transcript_98601/g.154064  ORF Transcript_98601/g.154064 Transcript_98601/m.154064 type:complete len:312 (-) Transcript_98601:58-993(-)
MADIVGINLATATEAEIKTAKREHAIREREKEFELKRAEDEVRKKNELDQARKDKEDKERLEQERTMAFLAQRAKQKADVKRQNEKKNAKREDNIAKKEAKWKEKALEQIFALKEKHEEYLDEVERRLYEARCAKQAKKDAERQAFLAKRTHREDLEVLREDNERERETKRLVKELSRVDAIKADAEDELRSFLNNPAPVPLKQVLAGRLRPVPTVTTLLAAHKDMAEDLKELQASDIPMRCAVRQQKLFEYIREIQAKAEADRIKPPEPVVGDMGRGSRSKSPKRAQSPTTTTGTFRRSSPQRSSMGRTQ